MNFRVCKLYHCPCISEYAKTVLDMKIFMSGLIIEMFKILDEHKYCYELFPDENSLLTSCREHLIKNFVFDLVLAFIIAKEDILFF